MAGSEDGDNQAEESPMEVKDDKPNPKTALLMSKVAALKEQVGNIVELAEAELGVKEDLSNICAEVRKLKQLADSFLSSASGPWEKKNQCQYVAKIQGLDQAYIKDVRNILQNAIGLGTMKFSPIRNASFVEINFTTEEIMNKALKIIRNKPLGLTLCVVETKQVEKSRLPPECVLDPAAVEFDPIIMEKESLLRSRELTEEEHGKMLVWEEKFIRHLLTKMCEKLDPDILTVVKDRTEGYLFKLEDIISTAMTATSHRYQTYSGVNPETDKLEMGFWRLGSDIPSRIPSSECVRVVVKVLTDFMESSDKPLYDLRVRKGFWDSIMIRTNHLDECMVVLVVHSESTAEATKDCGTLKSLLVDLFEKGDGADCGVKSVHMKALTESPKEGQWFHLYGDEHLDEEMAGLKLRLQKNTISRGDGSCSEHLCQTVVEELGLHEKAGVLHMGIAIGLVCMYLAQRCKMVVGTDRMHSVLPMTKRNVELNDLKNIELVHNGPKSALGALKTHFKDCDDVYAVVTETTGSILGKNEVLGLRKLPWVKKLAYLVIFCRDVTSTLKLLCSKTADSSEPFVMTKVIPFDSTSTSLRPDILFILERPAGLKGLTESRVPKTKARPAQETGPPAKKAKLNPAVQKGRQRPPPLLSQVNKRPTPLMYNNRGFGGNRNLQVNTGYMQQREQTFPWTQNDVRMQMMGYNSGPINTNSMVAAAVEETMMLERVRRQKEAQLQQIQEAVLEAQQRRLADTLMPAAPASSSIEEVVLSAIKKTGLLDKVSALTETTSKLQGDMGNDRWSGNYNQRGSDDMSNMGFQGRNNSGYQDRNTSGGFQNQDSYGYQGRESYQDRSSEFQNVNMGGDSAYNSGGSNSYQKNKYGSMFGSQ